MLKIALLLLAALPVLAQTPTPPPAPSDPPACLSAPVVKGTVTLSCFLIDSATYGQQSDLVTAFANQPLGYVFLVKVASSDLSVESVRVELSYVAALSTTAVEITPVISKRVALIQKVRGAFAYTFVIPAIYDSAFQPRALDIRQVTVKELQPASEQSF